MENNIVTPEFKVKVREAILAARVNFDGPDSGFAKKLAINAQVYSRLKNGQIEGLISQYDWLRIGEMLNVDVVDRKWNHARTEVFLMIEEDVAFCQTYAKARMFVDDCEIGKTHAAKYLSRTRKNVFYIDASQSKKKTQFLRNLANAIGVNWLGNIMDVKRQIKYTLRQLSVGGTNPMIIVDEAGDLDYTAFLELKEFWNATEGFCGWYLIGADGLRAKIERGIEQQKVGFREIFSRFSSRYSSIVPTDTASKAIFYERLLRQVLEQNVTKESNIDKIVAKCIHPDVTEKGKTVISGLRRAESALILFN